MDRKEIAKSYFARVTAGDLEAVNDLLTLDFVDHDSPPGTPSGPEAAKAFAGAMISHHPDLTVEVEDVFGEDDRVALDRIAERWSAYMSAA